MNKFRIKEIYAANVWNTKIINQACPNQPHKQIFHARLKKR